MDRARRRLALRRGAKPERVDLDSIQIASPVEDDQSVAVHEALDHLAVVDPVKAELVKLRFFVGLTIRQAADALGTASTSAKRHWAYARAWLYREMKGG